MNELENFPCVMFVRFFGFSLLDLMTTLAKWKSSKNSEFKNDLYFQVMMITFKMYNSTFLLLVMITLTYEALLERFRPLCLNLCFTAWTDVSVKLQLHITSLAL